VKSAQRSQGGIFGGVSKAKMVKKWSKNGQKWSKIVFLRSKSEKMVDFSCFRKTAWGATSKLANFGFLGGVSGREKALNLGK